MGADTLAQEALLQLQKYNFDFLASQEPAGDGEWVNGNLKLAQFASASAIEYRYTSF